MTNNTERFDIYQAVTDRMIVTAAGRAEKAARLILNRADEQEGE